MCYNFGMNNQEIDIESIITTDKSVVDGEQWYSVLLNQDSAWWLFTEQKPLQYIQWFDTTDQNWARIRKNYSFDVHEELYLLLKLKFS
jgi:hypothetical protein